MRESTCCDGHNGQKKKETHETQRRSWRQKKVENKCSDDINSTLTILCHKMGSIWIEWRTKKSWFFMLVVSPVWATWKSRHSVHRNPPWLTTDDATFTSRKGERINKQFFGVLSSFFSGCISSSVSINLMNWIGSEVLKTAALLATARPTCAIFLEGLKMMEDLFDRLEEIKTERVINLQIVPFCSVCDRFFVYSSS